MIHTHVRAPGVSTFHAAEGQASAVFNTEDVHFMPIQVNGTYTFDEYNMDLSSINNRDVRFAIYRQVDRVESSGTVMVKVPNTELTVAAVFPQQTFPLPAPVTLTAGSYWIAFQHESGANPVTSSYGFVETWVTMRWLLFVTGTFSMADSYTGVGNDLVYMDSNGSFGPLYAWAAIRYTGDQLP